MPEQDWSGVGHAYDTAAAVGLGYARDVLERMDQDLPDHYPRRHFLVHAGNVIRDLDRERTDFVDLAPSIAQAIGAPTEATRTLPDATQHNLDQFQGDVSFIYKASVAMRNLGADLDGNSYYKLAERMMREVLSGAHVETNTVGNTDEIATIIAQQEFRDKRGGVVTGAQVLEEMGKMENRSVADDLLLHDVPGRGAMIKRDDDNPRGNGVA